MIQIFYFIHIWVVQSIYTNQRLLLLYIYYVNYFIKNTSHVKIYFPKCLYLLLQATSAITMNPFLKNLKGRFKCFCSTAYFWPQSSMWNPMLLTEFSLDALSQSSLSTSAGQTTCLGPVNAGGVLDGRVYPESFQAAFELVLAANENLPEHPRRSRCA